jgi:hypothetical protein
MELVRTFPKGHAAPAPRVPWYEATVAYLLLIPAAILWFVTGPLIVGYWPCTGDGSAQCIGGEVLKSSTDSYDAIVAVAAIALAVAFGAAVTTQLTVRKLFFPLVWLISGFSLAMSVYAYAVMSGLVATPWGHLIPL